MKSIRSRLRKPHVCGLVFVFWIVSGCTTETMPENSVAGRTQAIVADQTVADPTSGGAGTVQLTETSRNTVEVAVTLDRPLYPGGAELNIQLGDRLAKPFRYPQNSDFRTLVVTLSRAEFDALPEGAAVKLALQSTDGVGKQVAKINKSNLVGR